MLQAPLLPTRCLVPQCLGMNKAGKAHPSCWSPRGAPYPAQAPTVASALSSQWDMGRAAELLGAHSTQAGGNDKTDMNWKSLKLSNKISSHGNEFDLSFSIKPSRFKSPREEL